MSLLSEYIDQHPKETKRLLGLSYEQLMQLVAHAEAAHLQKQDELNKQNPTLIAPGGGAKKKLSTLDAILLTIIYLRQHHTFQYLGIQFGVSESTAHTTFHYWLEILESLLPFSMIEQLKSKKSDLEWLKDILSEFELVTDTSEQPRQRPLDQQEVESCYSGYKRMPTFKNHFTVLPGGRDIVDFVPGKLGPTSDITIFRNNQYKFHEQQKFRGDLSYVGEPNITTPHKKPKGGKLTRNQKQENKVLSQYRVVVEHVIRLVKIFRVSQERFRLRTEWYQRVMHVVCGLVRFRIGALVLSILNFPKAAAEFSMVT